MSEFSTLITYLLSALGLAVLLVWPAAGPSAWVRDRWLRRVLTGSAEHVLDCYVCAGFWCGLALSPTWWYFTRIWWVWFGCLMIPGIFWFASLWQGLEPGEPARPREPGGDT